MHSSLAGDRSDCVTPVFGSNPGTSRDKPGYYAFTITDPAEVARMAAVINGLHPVQPGTYNCPAVVGAAMELTSMQLTFKTTPLSCSGGTWISAQHKDEPGRTKSWRPSPPAPCSLPS